MTTESDVIIPVLTVLATSREGQLLTRDVRREVRSIITLTPEDLEPLANRSDQRIDQVVRNLKSHKKCEGNPFREGLLEEVPRGYRITASGRKFLRDKMR